MNLMTNANGNIIGIDLNEDGIRDIKFGTDNSRLPFTEAEKIEIFNIYSDLSPKYPPACAESLGLN